MLAIPNMEKPKDCSECILADKHLNGLCEAKYYCRLEADSCPLIEIVRCGECKWCDDKGKGRALICTNPYIDMDIHPLDFCSYGERRADDTDNK